MPRVLDDYLGLSFWVYFQDHPPPHVHVKFGEFEAQVNINTGELIEGYLPTKKRKLALKIIKENQSRLIEEFIKYSNN